MQDSMSKTKLESYQKEVGHSMQAYQWPTIMTLQANDLWYAVPWIKNTTFRCCLVWLTKQCSCKLQLHMSRFDSKLHYQSKQHMLLQQQMPFNKHMQTNNQYNSFRHSMCKIPWDYTVWWRYAKLRTLHHMFLLTSTSTKPNRFSFIKLTKLQQSSQHASNKIKQGPIMLFHMSYSTTIGINNIDQQFEQHKTT